MTLVMAIIYVAVRGQLVPAAIEGGLAMPVFVMPQFSWNAAVSLAIPLFLVTMASQNLPGVAVA